MAALTFASSNNYIFLYEGRGADPTCVEETVKQLTAVCSDKYSVVKVDYSFIDREPPPSLLVFPGGGAGNMGIALRASIAKIKECVERGSGVLAFCAGAMFVSNKWDYRFRTSESPDGEGCSSFHFHEPLDLGPSAFGPAFENGTSADLESFKDPDCRLASILINGEKDSCISYWAKGPVFDELAEDDKIIACYVRETGINPLLSRVEKLAAVVHRPSYGSHGNVVVSGIHPELAEWAYHNGHPLSCADLINNAHLFRECCQRAGVVINALPEEERK